MRNQRGTGLHISPSACRYHTRLYRTTIMSGSSQSLDIVLLYQPNKEIVLCNMTESRQMNIPGGNVKVLHKALQLSQVL